MGRQLKKKTIYTAKPQQRPIEETAFAVWLKAHGITKNGAARLLGCAPRMIDLWCTGRVIPSLIYAFGIEAFTEGGVSVDMWLGTQIGRHNWQEFKRRSSFEKQTTSS